MEPPTDFAYPPLAWNSARFRFEVRKSPGEGNNLALGTAYDGARVVQARGGFAASRQDERRLREVHLLGDRLHLLVGQAAPVEKHRQLVAAEDPLGEDVVVKVAI